MKNLTEQLALAHPGASAVFPTAFIDAPHVLERDVVGVALPLKHIDALVAALPGSSLPPEIRGAVRKRQLSFVGGRLCAEAALQRLGCVNAAIDRDPDGAPIWPAGIAGSITHTDCFAYAVVGRSVDGAQLGIDSEPIFSDATLHEVSRLCCTQNERGRLLRPANRNLIATIIFSAKEALYKAIHARIRRFVDFPEIEIAAIDWQRSSIQLQPVSDGDLGALLAQCQSYFSIGNSAVHTSVQILPGTR